MKVSGCFGVTALLTVTDLTVHQSDRLWKETVLVSGCFGVLSSVAPTRREMLEQVVSMA